MSTVLIVDDQAQTRRLLDRILRYFGHSTVDVGSASEALAYLNDSVPDAVVLDYMMPEMDGLQVLRAVRKDPRTAKLPVIFYSAVGDPKIIATVMDAGASDFWVKANVDIAEMQVRLARWLPAEPLH
jgi:two-component system, chemotaxis family, chemotaxis protein CheY